MLEIVQDPEQVERLRTLMSGFCHRCRNSLNGIKMSLYLFRREARGAVPECWDEIESTYQELEHLFDHFQTIYRPMTIARVRAPLDELIGLHMPRWRAWFESRGLSLGVEAPSTEVVGEFDPAHLGVGLDAIAAWRAEVAPPGLLACIAWAARDGWLEVRWREHHDGDPPAPPERACASSRGGRGASAGGGGVLALPLLARVVAAHGGRVRREPGPGFGLVLRWPQSARDGCDGAA